MPQTTTDQMQKPIFSDGGNSGVHKRGSKFHTNPESVTPEGTYFKREDQPTKFKQTIICQFHKFVPSKFFNIVSLAHKHRNFLPLFLHKIQKKIVVYKFVKKEKKINLGDGLEYRKFTNRGSQHFLERRSKTSFPLPLCMPLLALSRHARREKTNRGTNV